MEQRQPSDTELPSAPPVTILVVDDEKVIRELCERALRNFRVVQAGDSAEALRLYEQERCDLVLTDVMMPGGSGIDLLRRIKELDPNALVIIMTGYSEKEVILNALKDGADDFIVKPLNLIQLKIAVEKALSRRRLKEELANLKRLDRLKSNFLSLVSHKLRTPITSISLFLQNVQQGFYEFQDPQFQQNARLVCDEAEYLGRLVAELLTFSKMMAGSDGLNLERCDLGSVLTQLLEQNHTYLERVSIQMDCPVEPFPQLTLDRSKIGFVLQQIIDNACKFSGPDAPVIIVLRMVGDRATVSVTDCGIGIKSEEIPKIFEKFYQVDPDNTGQVRGLGLGLFYAREFIRQQGGTLVIESEFGHGSTVTIAFPVQ